MGKEENTGNQYFLLFPQCVYPMKDNFNVLSNIQYVFFKTFQIGLDQIFVFWLKVNSLPKGKTWDHFNLKAFADNILNVVQMMICITDWVKNIVGKGSFPRVVKSQDNMVKSYMIWFVSKKIRKYWGG